MKYAYDPIFDDDWGAKFKRLGKLALFSSLFIGGCALGRVTYPEKYKVIIYTSKNSSNQKVFEGYVLERQVGKDGNCTIESEGFNASSSTEPLKMGILETKIEQQGK